MNSKEAFFRQQDPYTIVNTVLKMAKKRALIDAVLSATRSSGLFTQDIEDFPKQSNNKGGDNLATKQASDFIQDLLHLKEAYKEVEEIDIQQNKNQ